MTHSPGILAALVCAVAMLVPTGGNAGTAKPDSSRTLSRIDRFLATFDPIGEHVRRPIERRVPDLILKGFYRQWTDVLLTKDQDVGFRRKDFRFLQIQNLFETEAYYYLTDNLQITNVNHFLYDGVYDWQRSSGLFADEIDNTTRVYDDFERIVRELYVTYRTHRFDLSVGKQQIAWGKMDGRFIDVVNPMDRREAVQLDTADFEWRRLPTWMATTTFYLEDLSLQLLYVWDFEENRQPVPGSPWFSPLIPPSEENPDVVLAPDRPSTGDFGDHEAGLRTDFTAGALTWGLVYLFAWDKNATSVVVDQLGDGNTALVLQPRHERLHHIGITADYATSLSGVPLLGELPTVLRGEALGSLGVRFADFERRARAREGPLDPGTVERDTVRAAVAAEFALPANTLLFLQPSLFYTFGWKETLGPGFGGGFGDRWNLLPVLFVGRPFAFSRDRLQMELTLFPALSGPEKTWQGIKSELRVIFELSQFLTGQLIYTDYSGGDRNDLYGQYDEWDNLGWELAYEF